MVSGRENSFPFFPIHDLANDLDQTYCKFYQQSMLSLDVIQQAKLVQKVELPGKEVIVTTYCTH